MPSEPATPETVIEEIDALVARIQNATISPTIEYQRTKALKTLSGVREIMEAASVGPGQFPCFFFNLLGS